MQEKIVNGLFGDIEDEIAKWPWHKHVYNRLKHRWNDFAYFCKKIYQRIRYGFPLEESWDFRSGCARYAIPRLKRFRNNLHGYPTSLNNIEEWQGIIDQMIWSFEHMDDHVSPIYSDDYDHRYKVSETEDGYISYTPMNETGTIDWTPVNEHNDKVQAGLDLFAKYYQNLWD